MRKLTKIVLYLFLAFLIVVAIVSLVLRLMFPAAKLRNRVQDVIRQQIHRESQIGPVHVSAWGLTLERVRLSNVPDFNAGTFLYVEKASIRWSLLPLLRKEVEIEDIVLTSPQMAFIRMPDGQTMNISDLTQNSGKTSQHDVIPTSPTMPSRGKIKTKTQGSWAWHIDEIHLLHGTIRFDDHSPAHQTSTLSDIQISLRDFDSTQVRGQLAIGQLDNPSYNAKNFQADWHLTNMDPSLRHLTGSIRLHQGPGTILALQGLTNASPTAKIALLPLVMLQNIEKLGFLQLGLPDFSHMAIEKIEGNYELKNGIMKINTFAITGVQFSIGAQGLIDLSTQNLAVDAELHSSDRTVLGQMNMTFHISGTLSNPKTNIDSLKKKAFKATIKNLLQQPNVNRQINDTIKKLFH